MAASEGIISSCASNFAGRPLIRRHEVYPYSSDISACQASGFFRVLSGAQVDSHLLCKCVALLMHSPGQRNRVCQSSNAVCWLLALGMCGGEEREWKIEVKEAFTGRYRGEMSQLSRRPGYGEGIGMMLRIALSNRCSAAMLNVRSS